MKGLFGIFVLLLLAAWPGAALAQVNTGPVSPPDISPPDVSATDLCSSYPGALSEADLARYLATCQPPQPDSLTETRAKPMPPAMAPCSIAGIADPVLAQDLQAACIADLKHAFAYTAQMRDHNVKLYRWQAEASDDMRILVWVVVLAGIAMAIYQLAVIMQIELWRARRRKPVEAPILGEQSLELGLGKVQITSSVTGVIVLALSIAFLYLYLTEVYPIKPPPG